MYHQVRSGLSGCAFRALLASHRVSFTLTLLHLSNPLTGPIFIPGGDDEIVVRDSPG